MFGRGQRNEFESTAEVVGNLTRMGSPVACTGLQAMIDVKRNDSLWTVKLNRRMQQDRRIEPATKAED